MSSSISDCASSCCCNPSMPSLKGSSSVSYMYGSIIGRPGKRSSTDGSDEIVITLYSSIPMALILCTFLVLLASADLQSLHRLTLLHIIASVPLPLSHPYPATSLSAFSARIPDKGTRESRSHRSIAFRISWCQCRETQRCSSQRPYSKSCASCSTVSAWRLNGEEARKLEREALEEAVSGRFP